MTPFIGDTRDIYDAGRGLPDDAAHLPAGMKLKVVVDTRIEMPETAFQSSRLDKRTVSAEETIMSPPTQILICLRRRNDASPLPPTAQASMAVDYP